MATKDISDMQVLQAYEEMHIQMTSHCTDKTFEGVNKILMRITGQPLKVCICAMQRALKHGYIEYGCTLRSGWITEKGKELIKGDTKI